MDSRDRAVATPAWYDSLCEDTMTAKVWVEEEDGIETLRTVPVEFDVCPLCDGKGKHVNSSIDAHGIGSDEFYEDPDFAEEYMAGVYDVSCYECQGKRVVPICKDAEVNEYLIRQADEYDAYLAEREAEIRMGC